jgi:chemotaxis family two-component system response regulator Rcp1
MVKATQGCGTPPQAHVAPDGTGAGAFEVPLVEGSRGDVRLTREAFKDAYVHIKFTGLGMGRSSDPFWGAKGSTSMLLRLDLILLDLNLRKKGGREVLAEFQDSSVRKSIPVVIVATSATEADVQGSH